jgi:hypothetical protein
MVGGLPVPHEGHPIFQYTAIDGVLYIMCLYSTGSLRVLDDLLVAQSVTVALEHGLDCSFFLFSRLR